MSMVEAALAKLRASGPSDPELLDEITVFIRRYVVASDAQITVLSLFVLHTFAIEAADVTPFMAVTSPEKQSGKTQLLEVLALVVRNPLPAVSASESAIFRSIAQDTPTLLLDEVDAHFGPKARENEPLRAILNAGNRRRSAFVLRTEGEKEKRVVRFPVFCPRALAGIGKLPDTIADRSFPIRLRRRAPHETVERLRYRRAEAEGDYLRPRIEAWSSPAIPRLSEAQPETPSELSDRQRDMAEPLLAIADDFGGEWPTRARRALVELCSGSEASDESPGLRLLTDTRTVFDGSDRLPSAEICTRLNNLEESGWGGWHEGKGIVPRDLARLLKPYEIAPGKIRVGDGTLQGYLREQFAEPWQRWLRVPSGDHPEQAGQGNVRDPTETGLVPDVPNVPGFRGAAAGEAARPCAYHCGESSAPCTRCGSSAREHWMTIGE